jgi:hypothetical protein
MSVPEQSSRRLRGGAESRMKMNGVASMDDSGRGFRVPRIYLRSFQQRPAYAALHWHWFWSSADGLYVLRPPAPGLMRSQPRPLAIEALAHALVADLVADIETDTRREERR